MQSEFDSSLEIVILLFLGVFMLLFGLVLFPIAAGELPYNPDSTYGLFLVIVSFQIIAMGKTPFGDLRRSWASILTGMGAALLGMAACFIPGSLSGFIRLFVGIILFFGGISLFMQFCFSDKKARAWIKIPGILRQLTIACAAIYLLTIISGAITLFPGIATDRQTAFFLICYGVNFFYLAWCIRKVARVYAPAKPDASAPGQGSSGRVDPKRRFGLLREASLPLSLAILLLLGMLLTLLGLLLFPVNLGLLPFSPDGQMGLLLTIMAIQMMALGDTPLGRYRRSGPMLLAGLVFAGLGVVSCIVPGKLTGLVQTLLGLLNGMGGTLYLGKRFFPNVHGAGTRHEASALVHSLARQLDVTQILINMVAMLFGTCMIFPGLAPGLVVASILVINGLLLFTLIFLLQKATKIPEAALSLARPGPEHMPNQGAASNRAEQGGKRP